MKIRYLQHVSFEALGYIEEWATNERIHVSRTALFLDERFPELDTFDHLIIMGGPMGVHEEHRYAWLKPEKEFIYKALTAGKHVLGICLGAQLIAEVLGARVYPNREKEIGWFHVWKSVGLQGTTLDRILPAQFMAFHWHGDTFDIPMAAVPIGESEACKNKGFTYSDRVIAFQFHLESTSASVEALLTHCSEELRPGKFIQTPGAIKGNHPFIAESTGLMRKILQSLFSRPHS